MSNRLHSLSLAAAVMLLPLVAWGQTDKPCDPVYNLPWWEDFQAYPHNTTPPTEPSCWHFQGTNEPSIGQYEVHGSYVTCILDLYSTGETWAVLQNPFDVSLDINHMQVTFSAGKSSSSSAHNSDLIIGICCNPSNPVGNFTPLDTLLAIPYTRGDTMSRFTVDFAAYNDTGRYFCFLTKPIMSSGVNFLAIDSLVFGFNDHCMVPQNLHLANVTDQSAYFGWNQYASNHVEFAYKEVTDTGWTIVNATGRTCNLVNILTPNTNYMARLRQDCSLAYNGYSEWSDTVYFTTDSVRCRMPENLTMTDVSNTTATFEWTASGTASQWELHIFNSSYNRIFTANSNTYTVTGLNYGTNYRVAVRSMCNANDISNWTDTIMITTSRCFAVSDVTAEPDTHSAIIAWHPASDGNPTWEVVYGLPGFAEGSELGVIRVNDVPSTTIPRLDPHTTYVAKVRSICEGDRYSEYMSTTFTTLGEGQPQSIDGVEATQISVYPNPATTTTTIAMRGIEGKVTISIVGLDGRTLQTFVKDCQSDCETVLDVENLAAGTYIVRIQGEQINITRKFNVQ